MDWFFEHIRDGFEHAAATGIVQYVCDDESFFVTLTEREIRCAPGVHPAPTSVVRVPRAVLYRLVREPGAVDPRDPSIAAHVQVTGDGWLAHFIWWLTYRPSAPYVRRYRELEQLAAATAIRELTRVHRPSDGDLRDALARGAPVLATGRLDHWPVPADLESFKAEFGRIPFTAYQSSVGGTTLGELVDALAAGGAAKSPGLLLPPEMRSRFPPPCFGGRGFVDQQFWIGRVADTTQPITPLHRDPVPSFLGHLWGPKRFLLYSPLDANHLYALQKTFRKGQLCAVRPWAPDLARFPLFARARAIEVDLAPGDLLLIPAGWFHEAYAGDTVMSISSFFTDWTAEG